MVTWIHALRRKWVLKAGCCLGLRCSLHLLRRAMEQSWGSRSRADLCSGILKLLPWVWHFQTWISCRNMSWIENKCVMQVKCHCHCIPSLSADAFLGCAGSLPLLGLLGPLAGKEESRRLIPAQPGSLRWWCSCQWAQGLHPAFSLLWLSLMSTGAGMLR